MHLQWSTSSTPCTLESLLSSSFIFGKIPNNNKQRRHGHDGRRSGGWWCWFLLCLIPSCYKAQRFWLFPHIFPLHSGQELWNVTVGSFLKPWIFLLRRHRYRRRRHLNFVKVILLHQTTTTTTDTTCRPLQKLMTNKTDCLLKRDDQENIHMTNQKGGPCVQQQISTHNNNNNKISFAHSSILDRVDDNQVPISGTILLFFHHKNNNNNNNM